MLLCECFNFDQVHGQAITRKDLKILHQAPRTPMYLVDIISQRYNYLALPGIARFQFLITCSLQ